MQRREHLYHIVSLQFPAVFSSLSTLYKPCCHKPAAQSPVQQTRVPSTSHPQTTFFLCPHLLFLASSSLLPSTTMPIRATGSFPFPSPSAHPVGRPVVPRRQFLAAGEDSTGAFSLSPVCGAAVSLLCSQVVAET